MMMVAGSEDVMLSKKAETVSDDVEMELLGEPLEQLEGGLKTTQEELTEDQIDDLLGEEEPAVEQDGHSSSNSLEDVPSLEDVHSVEQEPTSTEEQAENKELPSEDAVEIANEEEAVVSSTENVEEDFEPIFTAHDLLAGEDEEEQDIVREEDITFIDQNGNSIESIASQSNEADGFEVDDLILVDEYPSTSNSKEAPRNGLYRQVLREYMSSLALKEPEKVFLMKIKSDTEKVKNILAMQTVNANQMRADYKKRENAILLDLAREKQKNLELLAKLSRATQRVSQIQRNIINSPGDFSKTPLANPPSRRESSEVSRSPSFSNFKRQVVANRPQPYNMPRQVSEPPLPETNANLPNRITINLALVENPRQCAITNPFDGMPLNDYPPGLAKALNNGTGRVEVVLKTEYDSFLISKKLHGVVKYNLPEGAQLPPRAFIRLYYLVESLHDSWLFGPAAKISETGTKFTMGFHNDQRLFLGDRVSFIAYVYLDQQTKFVSEQVVFKMRRPPLENGSCPTIDL